MKRVVIVAMLASLLVTAADAKTLKAKALRPMTLDQLVALHVDAKADVDRKALHAVLRERLQEADMDTLVQTWLRCSAKQVISVDFILPDLLEMPSEKSIVIRGRVTAVSSIREQIIDQTLKRVVDGVAFTVTVDVLGSVPPIEAKTLELQSGSGHEFINAIREGIEYLFNVHPQPDGKYAFAALLESRPVSEGCVDGMPADDAMRFLEKRYDIITGKLPAQDAVSAEDLKTDDVNAILPPLRLLSVTPKAAVPPELLVDTAARLYEKTAPVAEKNTRAFVNAIRLIMTALKKNPQPQASQRILDLYTADIERPKSLFSTAALDSHVIALALGLPAPQRAEALTKLLRPPFRVTEDRGIFSSSGLRSYVKSWTILTPPTLQTWIDTPGGDIDQLLGAALEHPENYLFSQQYEKDAIRAILAERAKKK